MSHIHVPKVKLNNTTVISSLALGSLDTSRDLLFFEDWCFYKVGAFVIPCPKNRFLSKRFLERQ